MEFTEWINWAVHDTRAITLCLSPANQLIQCALEHFRTSCVNHLRIIVAFSPQIGFAGICRFTFAKPPDFVRIIHFHSRKQPFTWMVQGSW